jgi:GMP synthase (glutamine-hydrolysing)
MVALFCESRRCSSSDLSQIREKLPMLAVCYGAQYLAHFGGGEVAASNTREYGES